MVSPAEAEQLRLAQAGLRALVNRDLEAFFFSLPLGTPETARNQLLEFVPVLVSQYGGDAAEFAADWYDTMRADAKVAGRFRAAAVASPYMPAIEGMVRRAAGALFTDEPSGALVTLHANTGKYVLAASRATITTASDTDPAAAGWQRITRADPCDFCRLLASRGGVYRRATVHFAAHGDCNCAAVPSWDKNAPEVDVRAYKASRRRTR